MKWKIAIAIILVLGLAGTYLWMTRIEATEPVFRDLCWGDPPEKLGPKRILRKEQGSLATYMKIDDSLRLGDLPLESILYCFRDKKLMAIVVTAKDYNALALAADLKYADAEFIREDEMGKWYAGIGKTTTTCLIERYTGYGGNVRMMLMDMGTTLDRFEKEYMDKVVKRANSW